MPNVNNLSAGLEAESTAPYLTTSSKERPDAVDRALDFYLNLTTPGGRWLNGVLNQHKAVLCSRRY